MLQQGLRRKSSKSSWVGASICFHFELIFCHLFVRQYVLCQLINQSHSETFIINSFSGSRDCNILLTPLPPFFNTLAHTNTEPSSNKRQFVVS